MKHSKEEIINALTVIKETCKEHGCQECPMMYNGNGGCNVRIYDPEDWDLNIPVEVWRAFNG